MIINTIREKSIEARKAKHTEDASLLVTLLSEVSMVGKNAGRDTTDAEAIAVIKKFINNNNETLSKLTDETRIALLKRENQILEQFMPVQMSRNEISATVKEIVDANGYHSMKQMGDVMKQLKLKFDGQFDSKIAIEVIKEQLK